MAVAAAVVVIVPPPPIAAATAIREREDDGASLSDDAVDDDAVGTKGRRLKSGRRSLDVDMVTTTRDRPEDEGAQGG